MQVGDLSRLRARLATRAPAQIDDADAQHAAVACVLRTVDDELEVLLIRRADRPGDHWSGQMAFPGGRAEPHDVDSRATALRETHEEVGLDLSERAEFIGPLDQQLPRMSRGLVVAPWVWHLAGPTPQLTPNAEVAAVVWAPLGPMMRGETRTEYPLVWRGMDVKMPGYRVGSDVVWGMTHRTLRSMFEILDDG